MDILQLAPATVIAVAIIATEAYKRAGFIPPKFGRSTIWLPGMVVGIVGAILLGLDAGKTPMAIAWDGITYGAVASSVVLIFKRTIKGGK